MNVDHQNLDNETYNCSACKGRLSIHDVDCDECPNCKAISQEGTSSLVLITYKEEVNKNIKERYNE